MIGAREGLKSICILFFVVAIEAGEVAGIETNMFVDVPSSTKTDRPTIAGKRRVLLISVGETIVGTLTTTADGKLTVDIPFDTGEDFVGTTSELLLAVVSHLGILIIVKVVFNCGTEV